MIELRRRSKRLPQRLNHSHSLMDAKAGHGLRVVMDNSRIRHFMSRHRRSIKDLALIWLIMLVGLFYAWQVDIFANQGNAPPKEQTIEVDEMLLLGGVLMLALLVFAVRRFI